jgi:putative ABC transport system substrate-binding protein
MMRRRRFIAGLGAASVTAPVGLRAQPLVLPVIGFLGFGDSVTHTGADAFLAGLEEFGYADGRNLAIEYRWAEGSLARLPGLAAELAALKPAAIVAFDPASPFVIEATRSIPIVVRTSGDPVRAGYVASLARPGGNVTGVTSFTHSLHGKRLEILRELLPAAGRVAILFDPGFDPGAGGVLESRDEVAAAARGLGFEIVDLPVGKRADLAPAFAAAGRDGAAALMTIRSPFIVASQTDIVELARRRRLPAVYDERAWIAAGGLISYGADLDAMHRRTAYFVDRILKGARPADLPMEEPNAFELLLNAGAAKTLGLAIPPSLLARADAVIE